MSTLVEQLLPPDLDEIIRSKSNDQHVWLVGGALRDHFLAINQPDLDFAVDGDAISLARGIADALDVPCYVLDEQRDTARVMLPGRGTLDFAGLRASTLNEDLRLRDFTINAMSVGLHEPDRLVDPLGGLHDLKAKLLRACAPDAMHRDPIRSLRAIRLSASLTLRFEDQTKERVRRSALALAECAAERRRDELARMLDPEWVTTSMRLMHRLELLPSVLPDQAMMAPEAWDRTLSKVRILSEIMGAVVGGFESERARNLPLAELSLKLGRYRTGLGDHLGELLPGGHRASQILFLAALYSDIVDAEERSYAGARDLRFSEAEAVRIRLITRHRERAAELERVPAALQAHRYFRDCGPAGIEAALLYLAISLERSPTQDMWETQVNVVRTLFEAWFEKHDVIVSPPQLLRGDELANGLGLSPGPIIGELLAAIAEEQVKTQISAGREALEFARGRLLGRS